VGIGVARPVSASSGAGISSFLRNENMAVLLDVAVERGGNPQNKYKRGA
jgi:hypothetical protein